MTLGKLLILIVFVLIFLYIILAIQRGNKLNKRIARLTIKIEKLSAPLERISSYGGRNER